MQVLIEGILNGRQVMELALQRCTDEIIQRQSKSEHAILEVPSAAADNNVAVEQFSIQNEVLNVLNFRRIDDRFEEVEQAHQKTFDWIFDDLKNCETQWDDLHTFLKTGHGCYWLSGKAGSGKSTLMKFICRHKKTKLALEDWKKHSGQVLLMPTFFFWSVGTSLQKSQHGLLRSLLYKILTVYPKLTKMVLPGLYEQAAKPPSSPRDPSDPSLNELRQTMRAVAAQNLQRFRICMFIDGIDEYDGETESLTELLAEISKNDGIKIVLSSRPTSDCYHSFQKYPKLRLQDLTYSDIERYVNDKLRVHPKLRELAAAKPEEAKALVDSLVAKADGVFLWVKLVVASLLRGLRNEDDIATLQLRADECPDDLLKLYRHMFGKLERHYSPKAAEIFYIMRSYEHDVLETITLWFADRGDFYTTISTDPMPMSEETYMRRCETIDHQLRSACCGLLETRTLGSRPSEIRYLHKSVSEFIQSTEVWREVVSSILDRTFNPHRSIAQAAVLHLREISVSQFYQGNVKFRRPEIWRWVRILVYHLQTHETTVSKSLSAVLGAFAATLDFAFKHRRWDSNDLIGLPCEQLCPSSFWSTGQSRTLTLEMSIAVRCGLSIFMRERLDQDQRCTTEKISPQLLTKALNFSVDELNGADWRSPLRHRRILIQALLRHGADFNSPTSDDDSGLSAWEKCLRLHRTPAAIAPRQEDTDFDLAAWARIMKYFVSHGADPNQPVPWHDDIPETPLYVVAQSMFRGLIGALRMGGDQIVDDGWVVLGPDAAASAHDRLPFTVELGHPHPPGHPRPRPEPVRGGKRGRKPDPFDGSLRPEMAAWTSCRDFPTTMI